MATREPLTLSMLRGAAWTCLMTRLVPTPARCLEALHVSNPATRLDEGDLWRTLLPYLSDEADRALVEGFVFPKLQGALVWSMGGESLRLQQLWQKWVLEPIGEPTELERRCWEVQQFRRIHQQDRQWSQQQQP